MTNDRVADIMRLLENKYPLAHCELNYGDSFQLLVAVILSAQCTDKRVNQVTEKLFPIASTPLAFAEIDRERLEELIYSCGFYHNKAKNIIACAKDILTKFGGNVPNTFDELLSLAGVGRKTANVVMSVAFGGGGIAVDTHVFRVSRRLALASGSTPYLVELELNKTLAGYDLARAHHLLIFHGRYCCHSRKPDCENCELRKYCQYFG